MAANGQGDAGIHTLTTRFYTRKVVRDLLWSITSPHLIDAAHFPVLSVAFGLHGGDAATASVNDWLTALDADPAHLIAFLQDKTKSNAKALALGVYFASLLEYWLQYCPVLRIVKFERGKQIISASNQTLGQLKFLFRVLQHNADNGQEVFDDYHVESSVKFFLLHPLNEQFQSPRDATEHNTDVGPVTYPLEQFVGPHLGENLAWRVQEVARKLDMCRGDSVQQWLRDRYSDRVASRIVLRGYLFYPLHHFDSTSDVSRDHDWQFHRNPFSGQSRSKRHNPHIGADHLRGWWASDLEHEFASRVRANDIANLGESRFAVLPKLHWLTPLIAEEISTDATRLLVHGEDDLHIETVDCMTLSELLAFAKAHFVTLAKSPAAQAKGGVVMPLLVAELVRCQPSDVEYDSSVGRWKELSRGFLLDPKSWDPLPLCHEPVRFKRTNEEDDKGGEREYEGRREWVNDGVIKPTEQEAELARQSKLHSFTDVKGVTPERMCQELLAILTRDHKTFTHSNLKQSVQSLLAHRASTAALGGESRFLLESLRFLVLRDCDLDYHVTDESKVVQRVAHLLLDAFEGRTTARVDDETLSQFVKLFEAVASDERRWNYINLSLRAIEIAIPTNSGSPFRLDAIDAFYSTVLHLLEKTLLRWNAVAVEIVRVVYAASQRASVASLRHDMLRTLMDQHDWKHAEQLATMCCTSDVELLVILYKHFDSLHMTKPMKRLRKALGCSQAASAFQQLDDVSPSNLLNPHTIGLQHPRGPPVDVDANRASIANQIPPLQWTLADTTDTIDEILTALKRVIEIRQQQPTIVGLDCEWRPQFLIKETAPIHLGEGDSVREDEGVSVYQIAFDDLVYVVDVQVLGVAAAAPLDFIWNAPRGAFLLVGFCVAGDLQRLHRSFPSLLLSNALTPSKLLVELKHLALYRQLPASPWGLSQLYDACFHEPVDKEEQCSDWGLRPLTSSQLQYAARDAYAVRNIAVHLLADVAFDEEDLTQYAQRFAVATNVSPINDIFLNVAVTKPHWLTALAPLNDSHVRAALVEFDLPAIAQSLFTVDKAVWKRVARLPEGLVVKTIAVVLRRGGHTPFGETVYYAAIVLHVDLSIQMAALAAHFSIPVDEIQLADRETLLRVFGYPRGSIGPIGLREQRAVHVVLDAALVSETALLVGGGCDDLTFAIAPRVLAETVGASVAHLTVEG